MGKIMIVDDNRQNREIAAGFLEDDHERLVVENGWECLEKLSGFNPDLILMDWMMPVMNGLQALEQIRESIARRNLRVVMLTAKVQPEDITTAWRAGANDYITKPFEMAELLEVVERQLAEKRKRDLADEKWQEMEESVRQSQKMEALGTLAGGIAHDFNNILFPIQAFAELLQRKKDPEVSDFADEIRKASLRAGNLVRQILAFSRQSRQEEQPVAVELIVKEAMKLLTASFPAHIKIVSRLEADCGIVLADPTAIHQVVMNLCTNAKHAMDEEGGAMTVTLAPYSEKEPVQGLEPDCSYLELAVADTGSGIPLEIRDKIFNPFFTTKPVGKGTGMGLSVVYGILKEMGGTVTVESEPNAGTTFRVFFPVRDSECSLPEEEAPEVEGGHGAIVVVDDEPVITELLKNVLEDLGYRILGFTRTGKALETLEKEGDLLLTDMTMPEMNGLELAEKAWTFRPDLPVILMTGFSDAVTTKTAKEKGIRDLLYKPVGRADLAEAIGRALKNHPI